MGAGEEPMFEVVISCRIRTGDSEYLAMKAHELLKELGTSELDTVYFSEVVGSVGGVSVALYLSRSNVGVLAVASACDDEGRCIAGPLREVTRVGGRLLRELRNFIEVLRVDYVVRTKLTLTSARRGNIVRYLRAGGVEVLDAGSYDAGWYTVRILKGKYIVSLKKLDVAIALVQERGGGLVSAQLTVSRSLHGVEELAEEELVDCLKAVSHIIAYVAG